MVISTKVDAIERSPLNWCFIRCELTALDERGYRELSSFVHFDFFVINLLVNELHDTPLFNRNDLIL